MKKKIFLLSFILFTLIVAIGWILTDGKITITTDIKSYSPAMSSVQGITITPHFNLKENYKNIEYQWSTEKGSFILAPFVSSKEVKNLGESVLWCACENDKVVEITDVFNIYVKVINTSNGKVLATKKLKIVPKGNQSYEIKI